MDNRYINQAKLVVQILPYLEKYKEFALKGGTALNYFVQNFPRLSVDIDLTYLPIKNRTESLDDISNLLLSLKNDIESGNENWHVLSRVLAGNTIALRVIEQGTIIKIEPNLIIRGSVFQREETRSIAAEAEKEFGMFTTAYCLSPPDLYGGKICAALDRQHPRDLFDIKLMLESRGLTDEIRHAFIVYLISHPRPMAELLAPHELDMSSVFENEFLGMTRIQVTLKLLVRARQTLVSELRSSLTDKERQFLLSIKLGEPKWSLAPLQKIDRLPAVQWKLQNIAKMSKSKHEYAIQKLLRALEL